MSFQAGTGYGRVAKAVLTTSQLTAGTRLKTTLEIGLWDESKYASRTKFEWPGETPPKEPEGPPPLTQGDELIGGGYLPVGTIVTVQTILYHSSAYQCIRASAGPQDQTGFLYTTHNGTDQVELYAPSPEPQPTEPEPGPQPPEPGPEPQEPEPRPEPEQPEPGPGPQSPEAPDGQPGDLQIEVHAGQTVVVEVKSSTTATMGGSSPKVPDNLPGTCGERPDPEIDPLKDYITKSIHDVLGESARAHGATTKPSGLGFKYFSPEGDPDKFYKAFLPISECDGHGRVKIVNKVNVYAKGKSKDHTVRYTKDYPPPRPGFLAAITSPGTSQGLKLVRALALSVNEVVYDWADESSGGRNLSLVFEGGDNQVQVHYIFRRYLDMKLPLNANPSPLEVVIGQRLRVYFEYQSAELKDGDPRLIAIIEYLKSSDRIRPKAIELKGHTDDQQRQPGVNQPLSEKRAESVKNYLLNNVPDLGSLEIKSRGVAEAEPLIPYEDKAGRKLAGAELENARAKNRCVEIEIVWDFEESPDY
jgi:outer membrane protein OmpA-like peptidoglycan-associated protein